MQKQTWIYESSEGQCFNIWKIVVVFYEWKYAYFDPISQPNIHMKISKNEEKSSSWLFSWSHAFMPHQIATLQKETEIKCPRLEAN